MNPEQHAIDLIDELMAQGLDAHGVPLDDYKRDRYVKCELCHQDWHGTPHSYNGCPGAYATQAQMEAWRIEYSKSVAWVTFYVLDAGSGDRFTAAYTDSAGREIRGTLTITSDGSGVVGFFIPDGTGEYTYAPIGHGLIADLYDDRPGLTADLYTYDEANRLDWPVPLTNPDGVVLHDTP